MIHFRSNKKAEQLLEIDINNPLFKKHEKFESEKILC